MSLNEIAVDLTCEPEEFEPASTPADDEETLPRHDEARLPGLLAFPTAVSTSASSESTSGKKYQVHSGMLKMARAMGDIGRPVHLAVHEALTYNLGYGEPNYPSTERSLCRLLTRASELILCGHSLGAGVASMLGLVSKHFHFFYFLPSDRCWDCVLQMWADPKTCLTVRTSGLPVGRKVSVYCFAPP